jgi:glycosyltransferase involved in cell wall biosynthesis
MRKSPSPKILIDGREFVLGKRTGIRRFLEGLLNALIASDLDLEVLLATTSKNAVPPELLTERITIVEELGKSFLASEKGLSDLTRTEITLLLSPYPKLPLYGTYCKAINTVHDVLDLTHPAYRKRFRIIFDRFRLRNALKQSYLTWYVSEWSQKETKRHMAMVGRNPRVRHSGIDARFRAGRFEKDDKVLQKYNLKSGYILVIGNGLPHKNLGVLLKIANSIPWDLVFVGVAEKNKNYWESRYRNVQSSWIVHVKDEDLPAIIRGAFCLSQPSTAEGYAFPPLEAMACGVPALVSDILVLKETTGGNALYADPNNPMEWIHVLKSLDNHATYQGQIEKGLKWIEPLWGTKGWQSHISDLAELLHLA